EYMRLSVIKFRDMVKEESGSLYEVSTYGNVTTGSSDEICGVRFKTETRFHHLEHLET
ncbi:unnamed protein product, partial [marine sediment metagenome]